MIAGFIGSLSWQLWHRSKNEDLYKYRGKFLTKNYLEYKKGLGQQSEVIKAEKEDQIETQSLISGSIKSK